ncbi:MAG: SPFH/Band 7/PHB domain protein [Chloroflexi bacterium]|nr:SPFH/Band 7/PHB domain protein [Chloroflexota bacterium]MCI0789901.1 SPFH/Band 7/PHB domain protein [Chloroflexota bacterium]MCI0801972.1 SPFH/Band 7/PHB domain protein [Chloroflexota bacterium]MCI0828774.1 SPFH/Band 7/PHB domain protein [Chloroflexota bacterium]MCI0862916.1 SPFH/Band 7/PHB domain protein [Chloroflexota bacterium]
MAAGLVLVQQYQKLIVQKFGTYVGTRSSGLHFLIPFVFNGTKVDLRERVTRVPTQKYITADNVVVDMDFVIYYRIMEEYAERAVLEIQNFELAVVNLAFATLRAVIGSTTLSEALAERERIRDALQVRMDEVTERWGVKISQVEINEIDPPPGVKAAMEREKSAEAIKTADITESEGARQSQINIAEGEKRAAILTAEGARQAEILQAEGEQQAAVLRASGFSEALEKINTVASKADGRTMSLQYFETLKSLGESPSTKWIFPMEFTSMLGNFLGMGSNKGEDDGKSK